MSLRNALIVGIPLFAANVWAAPTLTVGSISGQSGTSVTLPITFNPGTDAVSSLQFDLTIPTGLSTGTVTAGAILSTAGKSVTTALNGTTWRVLIFGLNTNAIANGTLLTAQVSIGASTPAGSLSLAISGVVYSDSNGASVPAGTNTNGSVTVSVISPPAPPVTPPAPPVTPPVSTPASVALGSISGQAGTSVTLPISFNTGSVSIASLQFDVTLPPSVSTGSVTAGSILTAAGKSVSASFTGGVWRFIIFGLNQTAIVSGNLLTVQIPIAAAAPSGTITLPVSGVIFSDPNGTVLASGTNSNGSIGVSVSGLPPLDLSGIDGRTYQTTDNLAFTYPVAGVSFDWTFQEVSASAPSARGVLSTGNAPLLTTQVPKLNLSQFTLTPGKYVLTVKVASGSQSQTKSATITLVSADLSGVKVFPNPWRSDKHSGRLITFDLLSADTTIKIFSTSGHEVKHLTSAGGSVPWDLTNESGDRVGSGVYMYLVTDGQGNKVKGKLAIIK